MMTKFNFFKRLTGIFAFSIIFSHFSFAETDAAASPSWVIQKAEFEVSKILDPVNDGFAYVEDYGVYRDAYFSFSKVTREFQGRIVIEEMDLKTYTHRNTEIKNVYVVVDLYGVSARLGWVQNVIFPIKGLKGKPISAIFDSNFVGFKYSVGLAAFVGVNLNISEVTNAAGVRVPDLEQIFQVGFNADYEFGYKVMNFNTKSILKHFKDQDSSGTVTVSGSAPRELKIEDFKRTIVGR